MAGVGLNSAAAAAAVAVLCCVGMIVAHECPRSVGELHEHARANSHLPGERGAMDALLDLHLLESGVMGVEAAFELYTGVLAKGYAPGSPEYLHRRGVFAENLGHIVAHNSAGTSSFTLGINKFTDWTDEEFASIYLGGMGRQDNKDWVPPYVPQPDEHPEGYTPFQYEHVQIGKPYVNWKEAGVVGPIKDQHINGSACGCCWAFATMGVVETAVAMSTGKPPVALSEQQAIACDFHPEDEQANAGCQGGYWWKGMDYIINNGGIGSSADWPYLATNSKCDKEKEKNNKIASIEGYEFIDSWNETALIATVMNQPAIVEVCVGLPFLKPWKAYRGGVFDITGCMDEIDHGITVVGFDKADYNGQGAWLLKNSWGPVWGEGGYLRVPMGAGDKVSEAKRKGAFNMYHRPAYPFLSSNTADTPVRFQRSQQLSSYL